MTPEYLLQVIAAGEGLHTEFKEARSGLPGSLFESICAMLNTDGGLIFLGVADDGTIIGLELGAAKNLMRDIANLSNNPQQLDLPYLLFPFEVDLQGKLVVVIQVPVSSQIHKHKGEVFLRSEDGDFKVRGTHQLAGIINRKLGIFTEQRLFPQFGVGDLRKDLLDRARNLIRANNENHPWLDLPDVGLLRLAGLLVENPETGKPSLTLAGILLFGDDIQIQQAVPAYKIDCLLKRHDIDRYDDRVIIRTNLLDAYDQMMAFVEKHLNDPFYLDGTQRVSLRSKIFREAISNIISHREYTSGSPARLMIYADKVVMDNPCTAHFFGRITEENLQPFAHNPNLCKFMIQLGRFDELGSGVRNINKYLPLYANGAKPEFWEKDHGFTLILPLGAPTRSEDQARSESGVESGVELGVESAMALKVLSHLGKSPLAKSEIARCLGKTKPTRYLNDLMVKLLQSGYVEYTIPDKPNSRLQKYRLTDKGRQMAKKAGKEEAEHE